jgi:CheY-like chemotaxis protein
MKRVLRIAVADDEVDVRDYYQRILPRLGHQLVAVAQTGRELVELCRALRPDLVITDIKMPDMDGIDAAAAICQNEPVPFILVSAYHRPQLFERAKADHILAYLVKPTKQADLVALARAVTHFSHRCTSHLCPDSGAFWSGSTPSYGRAERPAQRLLRFQGCRLACEEFDRPDSRLVEPRLQSAGRRSGETVLPAGTPVLANRFQQKHCLRVSPLDKSEHATVDPTEGWCQRVA